MLDLGWQELMIVAFVLVLVVGPKDLPRVLRAFAKFVGKARSMATEFQTSMMEVANQDELRDVKKALQDAKSGNFDEFAQGFDGVKESVEAIGADPAMAESIKSMKASAQGIKDEARIGAEPSIGAGVTPASTKTASKKVTGKKAAPKAARKKKAGKKTAKKSGRAAS